MTRDFGWICDELYRLHQDLEMIRARRADAAARLVTAIESWPEADLPQHADDAPESDQREQSE